MNNPDFHEMGAIFDALKERSQRIANRIQLWKNKLVSVFNKGQVNAKEESFLVWQLGRTERHCKDCKALNGVILLASEWKRIGIEPQSPQLECGGWNCDCSLKPSSGPSIGIENVPI